MAHTGLEEAGAGCQRGRRPQELRGPQVLWPSDQATRRQSSLAAAAAASNHHSASGHHTAHTALLHHIAWVHVCTDGELEGPREKETQNQDYQPASGAGAGAGCSPMVWHTPEYLPSQAAQSRCRAAAVVSDPGWSPLPPQPPLPTCFPNCLSHTWHPRGLWKSDQPCAALQGDSWYGAGAVVVTRGDGMENEPPARKQEQHCQGKERPVASTGCVTLGSLPGLSGLALL